jgi:hypothetical protein
MKLDELLSPQSQTGGGGFAPGFIHRRSHLTENVERQDVGNPGHRQILATNRRAVLSDNAHVRVTVYAIVERRLAIVDPLRGASLGFGGRSLALRCGDGGVIEGGAQEFAEFPRLHGGGRNEQTKRHPMQAAPTLLMGWDIHYEYLVLDTDLKETM